MTGGLSQATKTTWRKTDRLSENAKCICASWPEEMKFIALSPQFGILYLQKNQYLHSLFSDFGADRNITTRWSGARLQDWVQVLAPAGHLAITP